MNLQSMKGTSLCHFFSKAKKEKKQNSILKWDSSFRLPDRPGLAIKNMIKYSAKRLYLNRFDIRKTNNRFRLNTNSLHIENFKNSIESIVAPLWQTLWWKNQETNHFQNTEWVIWVSLQWIESFEFSLCINFTYVNISFILMIHA